MEKYNNLNNRIDSHLFNLYYVAEGMSCDISKIMANITKEKEKILRQHIDNVYPIKETKDGFYTKLNPKNRNHSGKISAKTRADLEIKIVAYYLEIKQNSKTLKEIIEAIVIEYTETNQESTGIRHKQALNKYFPNLLNLEVGKITTKTIEDSLSTLINNGITEDGFSKAVGVLNRIYKYCKKNKIDCINLTETITEFKNNLNGKHTFKQNVKLTKNLVFTEAETLKIIKHTLKHPNFKNLFVSLALTTGCRCGELLCMSYENIDLDTNFFYVYEMEDSHTQEIKPYTKGNKTREVYLNNNARQVLDALLKLRTAYKNTSKYLFLNDNSDDGKLHARAADNCLRELQKELKFDKTKELRSLHDCRRTYATIQFLKGIDIKFIQRQLGHSSIKQTEDYINDIIDTNRRGQVLEKGNLDLSV